MELEGGTLTADVALRDNGGSKFHLSGAAKAGSIELAGADVVDAAGYTGGPVSLTYTGADVLANVPLVTGCADEAAARRFTLTAGGAANIGYEAQPDGTWNVVAAATPLDENVAAFTEGTVYAISSRAERARLATLVNAGNSGEGSFFALTGDWQTAVFAGWDFSSVWNEGHGDTLPTLRGVGGSLSIPQQPTSGGGGGSSASAKPSVTAGKGGTARASAKDTVTITPDPGYRVAKVTVNGKEADVPEDGILTGLKGRDRVVVTFEAVPAEPEAVLTPEGFADLDPDAWYYDAVSYALAQGLFQGTSETTFGPGVPMSRAMFLTVLHRMSGEAAAEEEGLWYGTALDWAVERGLSDGTDPESPVTREQMTVLLWRHAQAPAGAGDPEAFSDGASVSPWAEDAMAWALSTGLLQGKDGGRLDPQGQATRAEVAAILQRFLTK